MVKHKHKHETKLISVDDIVDTFGLNRVYVFQCLHCSEFFVVDYRQLKRLLKGLYVKKLQWF